jgi:hypothetical protein
MAQPGGGRRGRKEEGEREGRERERGRGGRTRKERRREGRGQEGSRMMRFEDQMTPWFSRKRGMSGERGGS